MTAHRQFVPVTLDPARTGLESRWHVRWTRAHCSRGSLRTSNGWILFSQTNSSRSGRNGHRRLLRALSSCTPHAWATSSPASKARLYTTDAFRAPTFRHSPVGPPAQTHPGPHLCGPASAVHSHASAPHAQGTPCCRPLGPTHISVRRLLHHAQSRDGPAPLAWSPWACTAGPCPQGNPAADTRARLHASCGHLARARAACPPT
jgi:hypothetical protein